LVEDNWAVLDKVTSVDVLKAFRLIGRPLQLPVVASASDAAFRSRPRPLQLPVVASASDAAFHPLLRPRSSRMRQA